MGKQKPMILVDTTRTLMDYNHKPVEEGHLLTWKQCVEELEKELKVLKSKKTLSIEDAKVHDYLVRKIRFLKKNPRKVDEIDKIKKNLCSLRSQNHKDDNTPKG